MAEAIDPRLAEVEAAVNETFESGRLKPMTGVARRFATGEACAIGAAIYAKQPDTDNQYTLMEKLFRMNHVEVHALYEGFDLYYSGMPEKMDSWELLGRRLRERWIPRE